ncbi:NAD(P)H-hydrate dehydratase [Brachybacterium aquaticum]|uniref:ADP-dependent (S)-NAD(P)H-hydrate dehydratase n=1 Tax=Brachybacterium aquaticum TaxID=1432564 RepID=A0A841ABL6_9MICO|nr:NAD(P)H-hydrate dehydratase [Brachybacterium aquaticum]MBB5830692.1 hydroxyethylthiazole kinase-like uncharacterized protein yjeF [Brachybacterium aquaticum]
MIHGYSAAAVRAAEQPLLAAGEPLMLRAAAALATHAAERLRASGSPSADGPVDGTTTSTPATSTPTTDPTTPRVLVLAGAGANGGDGLHAAAILRREHGIPADAIATASSVHDEGAEALRDAGGTIHPSADLPEEQLRDLLADAELVLDAILGIGGRPEVPGALRPLLAAVRESGVPVLAVDLPSFVDATTGEAALETLPAAATVTFGAVKVGLLLPGGAELAGDLHLVDIGLGPYLDGFAANGAAADAPDAEASGAADASATATAADDRAPHVLRLEDADVRALFPVPGRDDSKYTRGVLAIAAGSEQFPGAAVLAVSGAARAGAGMIRCLAPREVLDLVLRVRPEAVVHPVGPGRSTQRILDDQTLARTSAVVVGPGLPGDDPRALRGVAMLAGEGTGPRRGVIDAGALQAVTAAHRFGPDTVLTPHRGEAERLARRLEVDPDLPGPELARALAAATGATVLLKGAITLVAPGNGGALRTQDDATSYLATAGTGDVLAGILGTLLAAGLPGPDAAALAALLHGRAGRLASGGGSHPLVALEVADRLPETIGTILATAQDLTRGAR